MSDIDQKPFVNNFDANEVGLLPAVPIQTVKTNYSKVFAYLFGRDIVGQVWRVLHTDLNGNLKISNGTQSTNSPKSSQFVTNATPKVCLAANPLRRGFAICNDCITGSNVGDRVLLTYPNPQGNSPISILPGWGYSDDSWSGDVLLATNQADQTVTVIEYY